MELPPFWGSTFAFPPTTVALDCFLEYACRHQIESPSYSWHGRKRSGKIAIWQYTLNGRGELNYRDQVYQLLPGQAFLVHVPQDHHYYYPADATAPWEFLSVCLEGAQSLRICTELEHRHGPVSRFPLESAAVQTLCDILRLGAAGQLRSPYDVSLQAYRMNLALVRSYAEQRASADTPPAFVQDVIAYCMEHMHEPLQVEDLCAVSGYSRFHFSRLFQQHTGSSPAAFLRCLRMEKAMRLLRTERLSVKEVANRCGFPTANYFAQCLHRHFGAWPSTFQPG